jgi:hypothetical protein
MSQNRAAVHFANLRDMPGDDLAIMGVDDESGPDNLAVPAIYTDSECTPSLGKRGR